MRSKNPHIKPSSNIQVKIQWGEEDIGKESGAGNTKTPPPARQLNWQNPSDVTIIELRNLFKDFQLLEKGLESFSYFWSV